MPKKTHRRQKADRRSTRRETERYKEVEAVEFHLDQNGVIGERANGEPFYVGDEKREGDTLIFLDGDDDVAPVDDDPPLDMNSEDYPWGTFSPWPGNEPQASRRWTDEAVKAEVEAQVRAHREALKKTFIDLLTTNNIGANTPRTVSVDIEAEALAVRLCRDYLLKAGEDPERVAGLNNLQDIARRVGMVLPPPHTMPPTLEWGERVTQHVLTWCAQRKGNKFTTVAAIPEDRQETGIKPKLEWLGKAMMLVAEHPEWSDAKIAKASNIGKSQLSRSRFYKAAAALARKQRAKPRGTSGIDPETKNREVDAVDESGGDQEEIDARIDLEITKRNATRNAKHHHNQ